MLLATHLFVDPGLGPHLKSDEQKGVPEGLPLQLLGLPTLPLFN